MIFFLSNCDTIINENYEDIYKHHKTKKNDITIVAAKKNSKFLMEFAEQKKIEFVNAGETRIKI